MRAVATFAWVALAVATPPVLAQSSGRIAGRVTTEAGTPLAGANVYLAGNAIGVLAGRDGRFVIAGVSAGPHRVGASLLGYSVEEVGPIEVRAGETAVANLLLRPQAIQLEQIVATGYGTTRRRDVTGAVASLSGDMLEMKAAPLLAVTDALQGKAPGVYVIRDSGIPGAGASVRVRGTTSITANAEPLYVLDGLAVVQGTSSTDPSYNPLDVLDPSEIESIDVLKDASATAIYGARGANGVVLITTKRGRPVENRITLSSSYGLQEIGRRIPVLTAPQFMQLVNEARVNAGRTPKYSQQQIDTAQTFDYPSLMLRTAPQLNESLTISGGDARTRYLLGGNMARQNGILVGSGFQRSGVRLNLDREYSERLRFGTSLAFTRVQQANSQVENGRLGGSAAGILAGMEYDPSVPPWDSPGNRNIGAYSVAMPNPLTTASELVNERRESHAIGTVFGELDLGRGLQVRGSLGGNFAFWRNPYFAPRSTWLGIASNGDAHVYSGQSSELTNEGQLTYSAGIGAQQKLDLLAGFSTQSGHFEDQTAAAQGFASDAVGWNDLGSGMTLRPASSSASNWVLLSYLARANYNLAERYLLTVTVRRDGSSRFGANHKWGLFPSAALAWRAANEPFLRGRLGPVNDLKLRLSYGRTGNQAVSEYQSLARLGTAFYAFGTSPVEAATVSPLDAAANPDLKWETTAQYDAGIDAALLQNRVGISVDAYLSVTRDLLLSTVLPSTTGHSTQLRNVGSLGNDGLELTIATVNVEGQRFGWRSVLTAAGNRNRVLSLGGASYLLPGSARLASYVDGGQSHIVQVGQSLGAIYGFRVTGLWQPGEPCSLKDPGQCTPGEYRIADVNGDGVIDLNDRTIVGYADPKVQGGLSNSLRYGPLTLEALLTYSYGNEVVNASGITTALVIGVVNERAEDLDRWRPDHPATQVPRANYARARRLYSTLVEDGSFVRLQSLTLGYTLPRPLLPAAQSARLYFTGQNLFLVTRYHGFDPEVNSYGGDPRLRGTDIGAYPRARAYNLGVSVTF